MNEIIAVAKVVTESIIKIWEWYFSLINESGLVKFISESFEIKTTTVTLVIMLVVVAVMCLVAAEIHKRIKSNLYTKISEVEIIEVTKINSVPMVAVRLPDNTIEEYAVNIYVYSVVKEIFDNNKKKTYPKIEDGFEWIIDENSKFKVYYKFAINELSYRFWKLRFPAGYGKKSINARHILKKRRKNLQIGNGKVSSTFSARRNKIETKLDPKPEDAMLNHISAGSK